MYIIFTTGWRSGVIHQWNVSRVEGMVEERRLLEILIIVSLKIRYNLKPEFRGEAFNNNNKSFFVLDILNY